MKNSALRRTVAITSLVGAFAFAGASAAFADEVDVPGTGVTKPCTVTYGDTINTAAIPPIVITSSTNCSI